MARFSFSERSKEKQVSRDRDASRLRLGLVNSADLSRENSMFPPETFKSVELLGSKRVKLAAK